MWKERVLLHLGWMDIDYATRKDEPPAVTNTSTEAEIALYEHWEGSNRLSVMFIKTKISVGIRGSIDQHTKVRDLLKAIDEQFVTSDKALASTLIMKFCSIRLDTVRVPETPQANTKESDFDAKLLLDELTVFMKKEKQMTENKTWISRNIAKGKYHFEEIEKEGEN
ncbi:hypothetical protein F0562_003595 [Nyssa sinensis]|uniref:Uncharacterized protein n=1 Tax=Nyssa sinensis TaxID=561372 RepID=A0A5J5BVV8_9ASTE|nr:hypothetical protein F0562_003595 [Nyssa sinensis]